jgi:hypothetical protein
LVEPESVEEPELVEEPAEAPMDEPTAPPLQPVAATSSAPATAPVVLDLDELGAQDGETPAPATVPLGDPDPVLVGAANEKSGLFGAVRAAFVRNKEPHQHEFVEAPGGIGITRRICTECGYISIGTTD